MLQCTSRSDWLAHQRVGLYLKVHAIREEDIPRRLEMVAEVLQCAVALVVDGVKVIQRVDILVWEDERYRAPAGARRNQSDCGKTAQALRDQVGSHPLVNIHRITHGDLFVSMANDAIMLQTRNQIDYSITISPEAASYLTVETMTAMVDAAAAGARVVGVAINELRDSILAGRVANTLAMWHNASLGSAGLFDSRAAVPVNDQRAFFMSGYDPKEGDVFYPLAGVEEMIPLVRMVRLYGECIAPILPQGADVPTYQTPDPVIAPDLYARHIRKMAAKAPRQDAFLAMEGADATFLMGGVMQAFRHKDVFGA